MRSVSPRGEASLRVPRPLRKRVHGSPRCVAGSVGKSRIVAKRVGGSCGEGQGHGASRSASVVSAREGGEPAAHGPQALPRPGALAGSRSSVCIFTMTNIHLWHGHTAASMVLDGSDRQSEREMGLMELGSEKAGLVVGRAGAAELVGSSRSGSRLVASAVEALVLRADRELCVPQPVRRTCSCPVAPIHRHRARRTLEGARVTQQQEPVTRVTAHHRQPEA